MTRELAQGPVRVTRASGLPGHPGFPGIVV